MSKIISVHSFRGGVGKSHTAANLAYLLYAIGKKVAIIDSVFQSPSLQLLFGIDSHQLSYTFNDYLLERCSMRQAAFDLGSHFGTPFKEGSLYLIASNPSLHEIVKILRESYSKETLIRGYKELALELGLDYLIIDTHPGINEEALLSLSVSDIALILLQPDDREGTLDLIELSKKLEVPSIYLLASKWISTTDAKVHQEMEKIFQVPFIGILPFSEEFTSLENGKLFSQLYPDHPVTRTWRRVAEKLIET